MRSGAGHRHGRKRRRRRHHGEFLDLPPLATDASAEEVPAADGGPSAPPLPQSGAHSIGGDPVLDDLGFHVGEVEESEDAVPLVADELYGGADSVNIGEEVPTSQTAPLTSGKSTDVSQVMSSGKTLAAVFAVVGTRRFAVWQYNSMRRRVNEYAELAGCALYPSYSKIQRTVFPVLRSNVFVQSHTTTIAADTTKSGAPCAVQREDGTLLAPKLDIRFVMVSSWGIGDLTRNCTRLGSSAEIGADQGLQGSMALFDSIEDAVVSRSRELVLSSAVICTIQLHGELEIPTAQYTRDCCVDLWLRPREPLGEFEGFVSRIGTRGNQVVLKAMMCRRARLETEQSTIFDPADVVVELHCNDGDARSLPSLTRIEMYVVYKLRTSPGIPRIHLAICDRSGDALRIKRVRCTHLTASSGHATAQTQDRIRHAAGEAMENGRVRGILQDGREYVIYRTILFADNFDPFVGRKGSAGGCYLLPVDVPFHCRTGVKGIRVLSMTPPGISTAKVITTVLADIVEGTVNGFKITDEKGDPVQMFIDIIGYECDYFAVSEDSDLRGHNGLAPCNLCTFPRGTRGGRHNSMFAYSTSIHSGNAAFRRDAARMEAYRKGSGTEKELQTIGLRNITDEHRHSLPLHAIHRALMEARPRVPRTLDGEPVVPAAFDPYLSIVIAPDHLFANLIKDVLNANIKALRKKEGNRACMHALLRKALRIHGIQSESQYINVEHGKFHSMSMSSLFEVILVAPWAIAVATTMDSSGLLDMSKFEGDEVVELAFMLQGLMADTNLYGRAHRDGTILARQFTRDGWKEREHFLKIQGMKYVETLDRCCGISENHAKELDKPNVHRLLELYMHTIPTYGHVRQYQELSLERTHQPLKRALNNSNFRSAQLQVMDHVLANEWKGRLKAAVGKSTTPEDLGEESMSDLRRALTGTGSADGADAVDASQMRKIFDAALLKDIQEYYTVPCDPGPGVGAQPVSWIGSGEYAMQNENSMFHELNNNAKAALHSQITLSDSATARGVDIIPTSRACAVLTEYGRKCSAHRDRFDTNVRCGDVLQAVVIIPEQGVIETIEDGTVLVLSAGFRDSQAGPGDTGDTGSTEMESSPSFWYVTGLFEAKPPVKVGSFSCHIFAAVIRMITTTENQGSGSDGTTSQVFDTYNLQHAPVSDGFLLPLYAGVMKPMCLHACQGECKFNTTSGAVDHVVRNDRTDRWLLYGSVQGFPPRSG